MVKECKKMPKGYDEYQEACGPCKCRLIIELNGNHNIMTIALTSNERRYSNDMFILYRTNSYESEMDTGLGKHDLLNNDIAKHFASIYEKIESIKKCRIGYIYPR